MIRLAHFLFIVLLWLAVLCVLIAGCVPANVLAPLKTEVDRYCHVPEDERALIRERVNGVIAPHTIKITCATPQ